MSKTQKLVAGALGVALLAAALPGAAVAQDETAEPEAYAAEGIDWVLTSYAVADGLIEVPEGVETTLLLNGGQVVGNAGCNSYFGSYAIDATSLTFPQPFGVTMQLCPGPEQAVEDAYLPLLESTAGWSVDEGSLVLTDATGAQILVYAEAPVEVTGSDIAALTAALGDLQAQIDTAEAEIAALIEAAESVNVDRIRNRISANEEAIAEINTTIGKLRNRIRTLEETAADHEERIAALEEPRPEPLSE